ncbi:MAG: DUF6056 family protein [Oscillospiraceae bacterium]|nr:DUF6056 family protein [Oscillospiraceae bacterium]
MKKFFAKITPQRFISIGVVAAFICCLIPLLSIANCTFPKADDFIFTLETHKIWVNGGSLGQILSCAARLAKDYYTSWQGSFSALFLMALAPSLWGESFYTLTPFILLLPLLFGNIYLFWVICRRYLHADIHSTIIISFTVTTLLMLYVPIPAQAFYWYNGGIYYTFFYSIMLFLCARCLVLYRCQKTGSAVLHTVCLSIGGFLLGGGNFSSSMVFCAVLLLLVLFTVFKKQYKHTAFLGCVTLFSLAGLFVNIAAPGYGVRQALVESYSPLQAIEKSIVAGADLLLEYTNWPIIVGFLFLLPFIYNLAAKASLNFRFPLIFTGISFGIFAMMICPTMYSLRIIGPGRISNLYYYAYFWFIACNLFYWSGWAHKQICTFLKTQGINADKLYSSLKSKLRSCLLRFTVIICSVLFICILQANVYITTTIIALGPLMHGGAASFRTQMQSRFDLYQDASVANVEVPALTFEWPMMTYGDIGTDADVFPNTAIAEYYGKDSVKVIE